MNYGNPRIKYQLKKLMEKGCEKILIFPMYHNIPQQQQEVIDKVYEFLNRPDGNQR